MSKTFLFLILIYSFSSTAQESKIFNDCLENENISETLNCLENCFNLFICYEINNDLNLLKLNDKQENLKATISITDSGDFLLEDYHTSNLTLLSALNRVVFFTSKEAEKIINNPLDLTNQKININLTLSTLDSNIIVVSDNLGKNIYEFETKKEQKKPIQNTNSQVFSPPIYPGCEFEDIEIRKSCMSTKIDNFIKENYNTEIIDNIASLSGIIQVDVSFKINTKGKVFNIIAKGPHNLLEFEAIRVMKLLPKMIPGKENGKNVNFAYSIPIIFQVANSD